MKPNSIQPNVLLSLLLFSMLSLTGFAADTNWPSFRGPQACGVADGFSTPIEWDVESGKNILWTTHVSGLGHSSPVVWGNRIFLTTAVNQAGQQELKTGLYGDVSSSGDTGEQRWLVCCFDKHSGKLLWQRTAHEGLPATKRHPKSTHANPTPATDGRRVVAFFGSEGLFCYDADGNLLWKKDLGRLDSGFFLAPSAEWGFGSSPVIHRDMVIVQCDVLSRCFIAAFNVQDGRELWRTRRDDVPTWSTPTVHEHQDRLQVIANGFKNAAGYDLKTGRELWKLSGGGDIPVPTPVVAHGLIYLTSAHGPMAPIYAIRFDATSDISLAQNTTTNAHIVWSTPRPDLLTL